MEGKVRIFLFSFSVNLEIFILINRKCKVQMNGKLTANHKSRPTLCGLLKLYDTKKDPYLIRRT